MAEFYEQLERIKDDITWKMILTGEHSIVLNQTTTGYFDTLTQQECKMIIRSFDFLKCATPSTINNLMYALQEDLSRLIDPILFRLCRSRIIGFRNGVFDLQTGKLREYTSSDFILEPLPHTLPEQIDPDIEDWFMKILADWVTEEVSDWFADVLAYFLFIYPNNESLWMNLFEGGQNGKSSCLKLLEKIVGDDKVIGCNLCHLNRFSNAGFQGKWLIIGRDSSNFPSDSAAGFIKNYSDAGKTTVELKGGDSYDTYTTGKIVISTNDLIQSRDRSFGWYRRFLPVPFPHQFDLNEEFEKNLFKQIPPIIRILLHRAYCYRQNKILVSQYIPEPVKRLKQETRYLNDRVAAFWEIKFFQTKDGKQTQTIPIPDEFFKIHQKTMSEVYKIYETWHHTFFGDGPVEPGLRTFGGPYGSFLTHAKKYFSYRRKGDGRYVELYPEKEQELREIK